jgi:hypothetical protein
MAPFSPAKQSGPADTVRLILAERRLLMSEVSRQSRIRFGGSRLFRIPPNFYEALGRASFSPSLHQLFVLSVVSGYRLTDWLRVFDLSFDEIGRLQASRPRFQTAELDPQVFDRHDIVAWFEETQTTPFGAEATALSRWLNGRVLRPLDSLSSKLAPSFHYLKIGSRDAYAFPDLLPGSVCRVDGRVSYQQLLDEKEPNRIVAIEHSRGIVCGRLRKVSPARFILCSAQLPYAPIELELGPEARMLGVVDLEIRRLEPLEEPEVLPIAGQSWKPGPVKFTPGRVGEALHRARMQSGLSLRHASEHTAQIAGILRNPNYFCAASALSDLEARDLLPRHVHKLISLCAVYCLSITDLAHLAGIQLENSGRETMPDRKERPSRGHKTDSWPSQFLKAVEDQFEEVPFFLRRAMPTLLGLPTCSVRDLFWAGATSECTHPYLRDSAFLAVNRKSKTPAPSLSSPLWAQPLYLLELRDGRRMCAACSLQNGLLVIRPCPTDSGKLLRLRNRVDAEVLGKIVAIVRRLGNSPKRT